VIGAEHIAWDALESVATAFADRGLTTAALTPAYGMAEATLVATTGELSREPKFVDVDVQALDHQQIVFVEPDHPAARRLVSCGTCLPGVTVCCEETSGEIIVRSPSLGSGYVGDEDATHERFTNNGFRSGDIGFMSDEQLYVVGRMDDCVIVGGRNIYVQDIEQQLTVHAALRRGSCAIVEAPQGSGRIGLVAEVNSNALDPADVALALRSAAIRHGGPPITDFAFVPRGRFPKTPSGKAQRYRCRELLATDEPGIRIRLASAAHN
jgi:acyl-CoA synthetase (AMP-forming)/AMP-acid ligase II